MVKDVGILNHCKKDRDLSSRFREMSCWACWSIFVWVFDTSSSSA